MATTDADGRATLKVLPKKGTYFVATKPGFAETYSAREQDKIRLTPSATLSGRLTGPGGEPLPGVKVVLHSTFLWNFVRTVTNADGRYELSDLMARGWDMSLWAPNQEGDGKYKIWIDDDRFVIPTQSLTLEPATKSTMDLEAMPAGVIRVTLVEQGTNKPVSGARIWGSDAETQGSGRFNAYTDERGCATFYSAPSQIFLSLVGPPAGVYLKDKAREATKTSASFEFAGGETDIEFVMPAIAGPLINVSGVCKLQDGSPALDAIVNAGTGLIETAEGSSNNRNFHSGADGRFILEKVPGRPNDRTLCGDGRSKVCRNGQFQRSEDGGPGIQHGRNAGAHRRRRDGTIRRDRKAAELTEAAPDSESWRTRILFRQTDSGIGRPRQCQNRRHCSWTFIPAPGRCPGAKPTDCSTSRRTSASI